MYYDHVKYCPMCGYKFVKSDYKEDLKLHKCQDCGFQYYHNMVPTSSVIIPKLDDPNTILLTRRNMDPHKGKLDLPGGFFIYGERVEEGAKREIMEELGLDLKLDKLLGVELNNYKYQQYHYQHTTIYFTTEPVDTLPQITDKDENSEVVFFNLNNLEIEHDSFAFEADYRILLKYKLQIARDTK